jgi:Sulfotransferase family
VGVRGTLGGLQEARRKRRPWLDPPAPRTFLRSALHGYRRRAEFSSVRAVCIFIGCPRTGSTLLCSLLTAHPNAVVSNELNVLRYVQFGFRREQLFSLILDRDNDFGRRDRHWGGHDHHYSYVVPESDQGRVSALQVIGDKRGADSCGLLAANPDLVDLLERRVGVRVHILHTIRDPYDTVATMSRQSGKSLDDRIETHLRLCQIVARFRQEKPQTPVLEVGSEDLVADPRAALRRVCEFLGLDADQDYLDRCAAIVQPSPHRSRTEVSWTPEQLARVRSMIEEFDFLARRYEPGWTPGTG